MLAGDDRRAIADDLVGAFDAAASGAGPIVVSLESSLGLGKTRLVQEFYRRLAATRQAKGPYWPPALDHDVDDQSNGRRDVHHARKQVEPTPGWVIPGGVGIPWLWWGISCQLAHSGSPLRAMKDAGDQLRAHLDPLRKTLERSDRNKEDALELLSGVFDLVGVINPGAVFEAAPKFLGVFRRRRERRKDVAAKCSIGALIPSETPIPKRLRSRRASLPWRERERRLSSWLTTPTGRTLG